MKVLVLGGTGLISTAITRLLVERGDEVTLYNRGQHKAELPAGVQRILGDRTEYDAFEAQMAEAGPFDAVVDMVAFEPADVQSAVRAFRGRAAQYVFCSTVDVYTKPAARYPIREEAERNPSPSFSYAYNKAACERLLEEAHERGDLAVTMIRPTYTYGGLNILHSFGWGAFYLERIRRGAPIIVHGDGTSFWSACHRDDVARAFVGALGNERVFGQGYHVTGEEWMTWDAYHQGVARAMGAPSPVLVHIPTEALRRALPKAAYWCVENFHYNNIFDNTAAHSDLGFRYTIPWEEGVRRVLAQIEASGGTEDAGEPAYYQRLLEAWDRLSRRLARDLQGLDAWPLPWRVGQVYVSDEM